MGHNGNTHDDSDSSQPEEPDSAWTDQPHLTLLVENIPGHWMVADLKEFLDSFGHIVKLEIFEDREEIILSQSDF